jgi:hypothetical protein
MPPAAPERMIASMSNPTTKLTAERLLIWMAWRRYLTRVQASEPWAYEAVEAHAWEALLEDLASVGAPLDRRAVPLAA